MIQKIFIIIFFLLLPTFASAQVIIEDEETQNYLYSLIKPIYNAAGIPFSEDKVHIILDDNINAFVISGGHLFINTGLIIQAQSSNEISGVIAHEAGHIKAGHIFKQKLKIKELQTVSLASMIIAGLAGAASGQGEVAMAGIYGGQGMLIGKFLEYKKEDERAADEFAIKTLKKANVPNEDLSNFLKRLQQKNYMQGITERSYFTTHPLTQERITYLDNNKTKNTTTNKNDLELKTIKAKLYAFTQEPKKTIKKYYNKNNYAMAIAMFKALKLKEAKQYLKALIKDNPQNPYYYELQGQIFYETAQPQAAYQSYKKALELLPNSSHYKSYLASAIIEGFDSKDKIKEAISLLKQANIKQKKTSNYLLLARAYGKIGDNANALLASAQYSASIGNISVAHKQAKKAKELSNNPMLIIKADDILSIKDPKPQRRRNI